MWRGDIIRSSGKFHYYILVRQILSDLGPNPLLRDKVRFFGQKCCLYIGDLRYAWWPAVSLEHFLQLGHKGQKGHIFSNPLKNIFVYTEWKCGTHEAQKYFYFWNWPSRNRFINIWKGQKVKVVFNIVSKSCPNIVVFGIKWKVVMKQTRRLYSVCHWLPIKSKGCFLSDFQRLLRHV